MLRSLEKWRTNMGNVNGTKVLYPEPKPKSLWFNCWDYFDPEYALQIFIGPRGPGKTYSVLKGLIERDEYFLYTRRTLDEVEQICDANNDEKYNPFYPLNEDLGWNLGFKKLDKKTGGLFERILDPTREKYDYVGQSKAMLSSLFDLGKIRGSGLTKCKHWFYDEFIPERTVRKVRGEGEALMQAYETVNRNREFTGEPPLYLWMAANSLDIYNPYFVSLKIINVVERMISQGKEDALLPDRKIAIHLVEPSEEFKAKKAKTATAAIAKGTDFEQIAFKNVFVFNDMSLIGYEDLRGFHPYCGFGEWTIYKKKGQKYLYVSYAYGQCRRYNPKNHHDMLAFCRCEGILVRELYLQGRIKFESYEIKQAILDIIIF